MIYLQQQGGNSDATLASRVSRNSNTGSYMLVYGGLVRLLLEARIKKRVGDAGARMTEQSTELGQIGKEEVLK